MENFRQIWELLPSFPPENTEEKFVHLKVIFELYQLWTLNKKHSAGFSNRYSSCTEQHFEQSIVFWKKHFFIFNCDLEWKKSAGSSNLLLFCRGEQLEVKHVFGTELIFPNFSTLHERLSKELRTAFWLSGGTFWSKMYFLEFLKTSIFLRLWVKSYQRNCQRGFLCVQGNVSSGNIFWKNYTFLMFSRNKATFLGTTDIKPWEGCQMCSLEVQRTFLGKNKNFEKKIFEKKFRTSGGKFSADLRTAFVVCNGTCWGKSGSPQRGILFVPTLNSERKTLVRFVKPLLEASRATFLRKKCFLEQTLLILIWDLEWKTIGRVVKLASYMTTKTNWSKTCFFRKAKFSCFFSFLRVNDFRQIWEPQSTCPKERFGAFQLTKNLLVIILQVWAKNLSEIWWKVFSMAFRAEFKVSRRTFWCTTIFGKVRLLLSIRDFER